MINENFVLIGILIQLLGDASYIKDTLQGKIQPNRISWGLWAIPVIIAFFAEISQGVGIQALTTFFIGFVPFLIFVASFVNKKAYWKLTKFDLFCGILSFSGLILWYITKSANTAILLSIFADLLAGIPTLRKAYKHPETENWVGFMTSFISGAVALLTIKTWTFAYFAFPLYIFLFDLVAFVLIRFKMGAKLDFKHLINTKGVF